MHSFAEAKLSTWRTFTRPRRDAAVGRPGVQPAAGPAAAPVGRRPGRPGRLGDQRERWNRYRDRLSAASVATTETRYWPGPSLRPSDRTFCPALPARFSVRTVRKRPFFFFSILMPSEAASERRSFRLP